MRVHLADEFSFYPMGRTDEDGDDNGRRFFLEFLLPNIQENKPVEIIFDGVHAFGSSFLDEAFGEMPKQHEVSGEKFRRLVTIEATGRAYSFYKRMAEGFMSQIPS